MLDRGLAEFFGVPTKALSQEVTRNIGRFPGEFMFQLTQEEGDLLADLLSDQDPFRDRGEELS
jgi:hypothetical protein